VCPARAADTRPGAAARGATKKGGQVRWEGAFATATAVNTNTWAKVAGAAAKSEMKPKGK